MNINAFASVLRASLAALAATILVAACGGGSGDATRVNSTRDFALASAFQQYFAATGSQSFTLAGTKSGLAVEGSGTLTEAPLQPATFEGQAALLKQSIVSGSITVQGVQVPLYTITNTYLSGDLVPLGSFADGEYVVLQQPVEVPATARVGDGGTWYVADVYTDSSKAIALGSLLASYALEADTASTAVLVITFTSRDVGLNPISTAAARFRLQPDGTPTRLSESVNDPTGSIAINY